MKLRGRSPSCGIYYLEPLRAKRGAEEPVGRTHSYTYTSPFIIPQFHFLVNKLQFHFIEWNFISKPTLSLEFHFPTPTTPTLPHSCVSYPTPTPISCGNKEKNYIVKYLTLRANCATHPFSYYIFPYPTPTYRKFVGYLFCYPPLPFAL